MDDKLHGKYLMLSIFLQNNIFFPVHMVYHLNSYPKMPSVPWIRGLSLDTLLYFFFVGWIASINILSTWRADCDFFFSLV